MLKCPFYPDVRIERVLTKKKKKKRHRHMAPNDGFRLNTLKTLFRLSRVLLDL